MMHTRKTAATRKEHPVQIPAPRADAIRDRFVRIAAERRTQAAAARAAGDTTSADALDRLAESQERMAAKRYEAMTARAA